MRVLLDTDVVLDLLLDRAPFSDAADAAGLEAIITRNDRDYELARLPIYTPGDFVERHLTPPPQNKAQ